MTIKIPPVLRPAVGGERQITASGSTVGEVLDGLYSQHPSVQAQLQAEDGSLHRFVNLYLNDEDVRFLGGLDTTIGDGDAVTILPAVAGGAGPAGL